MSIANFSLLLSGVSDVSLLLPAKADNIASCCHSILGFILSFSGLIICEDSESLNNNAATPNFPKSATCTLH